MCASDDAFQNIWEFHIPVKESGHFSHRLSTLIIYQKQVSECKVGFNCNCNTLNTHAYGMCACIYIYIQNNWECQLFVY